MAFGSDLDVAACFTVALPGKSKGEILRGAVVIVTVCLCLNERLQRNAPQSPERENRTKPAMLKRLLYGKTYCSLRITNDYKLVCCHVAFH